MSRHSFVVALSVVSFSSIACGAGEDTDATTSSAVVSTQQAESFCSSYCGRQAECDSSVDVDTCSVECEDATSSAFRRFRSDVIEPTRECFVTSDCRSVLSGDRLAECLEESALMVSPGSAAQAFCDAFGKALAQCDYVMSRADCLSATRWYGDEALARANACLEKSCSSMLACVDAELSLD